MILTSVTVHHRPISKQQIVITYKYFLFAIVMYNQFGPLKNKKCRFFFPGESQEYCQLQTFEPRCWKNEVIVIEKALYGRHKIGKCISEKEAAYSQDSDFFGCYADVREVVNRKCSGRKQCEIRVPDADLERTRTCLPGLQMFLEVSYKCLEGK